MHGRMDRHTRTLQAPGKRQVSHLGELQAAGLGNFRTNQSWATRNHCSDTAFQAGIHIKPGQGDRPASLSFHKGGASGGESMPRRGGGRGHLTHTHTTLWLPASQSLPSMGFLVDLHQC